MNSNLIYKIIIGKFTFTRLIRSSLLIYIIFAVYIFFRADSMIFLPHPSSYQDSDKIIKLTSPDQIQLSAIYLPHPQATYTILYVHGNAEDLGDIEPILQQLQQLRFNVFAYDYRGYGTSQGKPSEKNAYRDIETAYQYLVQNLHIPPEKILVYGRSVGGGSAVDLATHHPVAGLILESTFTSAFRVVVSFPILPFDKFPNRNKLKNIDCPILIMHGTADEVIPFEHGLQIFAAASEPKLSLWVEQAAHNDFMWVAGKKYEETLQEFVERFL